jgi:hypothetical protein
MKLLKSLLFPLLLTISLPEAYAQMGMGKVEEIEEVQKRKLIVLIEEPRERMIKKLTKNSKRGSVEDYKSDLQTYNATLKTVVEKFWPYNKEGVQYKTIGEIEKLANSKTKDYAILTCLSTRPRATSGGYKNYEGLYWVKDIKDEFEDQDLDMMFTTMVINVIEDFGRTPVYYVPLYDVFPTKASLVFGMKTMTSYFDMRIRTKKEGGKMRDEREKFEQDLAAKASLIPQKTLLVRREWIDEDLNEQNLKTVYPYPYKFVTREEMDEIVMSEDPAYAYAAVLPYVMSTSNANAVMYIKYVIDCADSSPMAMIRPGYGAMTLAGGIGSKAGARNYTRKSFEAVIEQIKEKK